MTFRPTAALRFSTIKLKLNSFIIVCHKAYNALSWQQNSIWTYFITTCQCNVCVVFGHYRPDIYEREIWEREFCRIDKWVIGLTKSPTRPCHVCSNSTDMWIWYSIIAFRVTGSLVLPSIYRHTHGLSCDLKVVVVMFTHGLDIELSVGLLPTLIFPHSAFYPPFRIHFHIFWFRILLSAFRNSAFYQWP